MIISHISQNILNQSSFQNVYIVDSGFMKLPNSTLYTSNYSKKNIVIISLIVSISTFIGGLIMFILGSVPAIVEAILLGITLGMLIYISLFELLHQIYHMKNTKISRIGICFGIILLIICLLIKHHI
jgi:zinc transporter ZupT